VPRLQQEFVKRRGDILAQVSVARRNQQRVRSYASARASVQVTMSHAEQIIDEIEAEIKGKNAASLPHHSGSRGHLPARRGDTLCLSLK